MTSANEKTPANGAPACPICGAPVQKAYAPFCSKRCADIDLHRWLSGSYAIPASDDESEGSAEDVSER